MKKHRYFGLISLVLFATNVMYSGGEALADSRIAACFSKTRGLVNIIKNELEPTDNLATPELTNKCKKLKGTLVIWAKEGLAGSPGQVGATGPVGLTGAQGLKGDKGDPGRDGITGTTCTQLVHVSGTPFGPDTVIHYIAPVGEPCTSIPPPPPPPVVSAIPISALQSAAVSVSSAICQQPNAGQNLVGCDLTDPGVSFDFVARDLRGANLVEANLTAVDLALFNFSGANLVEANLTGANFYAQNAENKTADFSFSNLSGANLSNAKLPFANLNGARLDSVNFSGADLCGAKFSLSNISAPEIMPQPIGITWSNTTICPNGEAPVSQSGVLQCVGQQLVPTEICS